MNCRHAHRLFGAYWDDEITQAEREWLEGHFTACSSCRAEYESYARALEALATMPRVEPQPNFAERVLQRARRASTAPDRLDPVAVPRRWVPLAAAAGVLVVAAAATAPWFLAPRGPAPIASRTTPAPTAPARVTEPTLEPAPSSSVGQPVAAVVPESSPDSLFDHSGDVEFILDPVVLRRGRASVTRVPAGGSGEHSVVSF